MPSLVMVQFAVSSLAVGAVLSYILILSILLVFGIPVGFSKSPSKIFIIYSLALFIHGSVVCIFSANFDFYRFIGSYLVFSLMYTSILVFKNLFDLNFFTNYIINKTIISMFKLIVFFGVVAFFLNISPNIKYSQLNKGVFPFFEPSHFGLSVSPFLFYYINSNINKFSKAFFLFIFISFLVVINNLTILVVTVFAIFFMLKGKKEYFLGFVLLFPTLILIIFNNVDYYSSRMIQNDSDNLSTLVWLQGWENALIMFKRTFGLGVGFQQFGIGGLSGNATEAISILRAGDENSTLNQLDGGTLGAKIIGEFGLIGIIVVVYITKLCVLSIYRLKFDDRVKFNSIQLFSLCIISSFLIEIFVRSMSYISNPMFFFLMALTILKCSKNPGIDNL
jgi:hypothetical protein